LKKSGSIEALRIDANQPPPSRRIFRFEKKRLH